jgi:uncharacterized protein YndB with AHSA1/START domain
MATHRISLLIDAPPERVFDAFMDLGRMHEWVGGVTGVSDVTGPVDQAGTRYTVHFGPMASPTQILEVERPRHVRTRFGNLLLKGESTATFEPEAGGTRLTQQYRTRGIVSAIMARVFATGSHKGSFRGELETLRDLIHQDQARDMS